MRHVLKIPRLLKIGGRTVIRICLIGLLAVVIALFILLTMTAAAW